MTADTQYEFDNPSRAAVPKAALWDPGFAGTPYDSGGARRRTLGISNQSYAHLVPFGRRGNLMWTNRWNELEPIISNRGPQYVSSDIAPYPAGSKGRWTLFNGPTGINSYTLLFYGKPDRWEGFVAFNDGHVSYETEPTTTNAFYTRASAPFFARDNIFVSENDGPAGTADTGANFSRGRNAFLRPIANVLVSGSAANLTLWRD